jgi:hypothetical protein
MPREATAAIPILNASIRELEVSNPPLALWAKVERAAAEYYAGRLTSALRLMARIESVARARRYGVIATRAAWVEGLTRYGASDFAGAQRAYESMLQHATSGGDGDHATMAHVLLANLHWTLGDRTTGWRHRVAAAGRLDASTPSTAAAYYVSAAGDLTAAGYHSAALIFESRPLRAPAGIPASTEVQARVQRAQSLHRMGDQQASISDLHLARARLADIADPAGRGRVEVDVLAAEAEIMLASDPGAARTAAERALALPLANRDHLRRARLNLRLAHAAIRTGDTAAAERAVTSGLDALETLTASPTADLVAGAADASWDLYAVGAELALARQDVARAFDLYERGRLRSVAERQAWGRKPTTLDALQQRLSPAAALVMVSQSRHQAGVWVIRRDRVHRHEAKLSPVSGASLVTAHLDEISRSAETASAAAALYDALLRPAESALAGMRELIIVADAPFDRVAYAALWDARQRRFLVEHHAIALVPSASAYVAALERRATAPLAPARRAAILDTPDPERPFGSGARLADALTAVYDRADVRQIEAPTTAHLIDAVAGGEIVHVSAKAYPNSRHPSLSRLVLADAPGERYSGDLIAQRLTSIRRVEARLMALDTAAPRPDVVAAVSGLDLARTILAVGVPTVVTQIMLGESQPLRSTWVEFHRHVAGGVAPAESLRRAQLQALGQLNRRPGPWATLTVFGSTH